MSRVSNMDREEKYISGCLGLGMTPGGAGDDSPGEQHFLFT